MSSRLCTASTSGLRAEFRFGRPSLRVLKVRFNARGKEFGCGVPVGSWVYGSCSRVGERLESFDEVGKPFVVEREAVLHLRCESHELASDLKEEALKILELTNRLFEERIVVSDAPPTPTSWIAISDEQGQIVSDTAAHDFHFG